jgi:hypothetical protein
LSVIGAAYTANSVARNFFCMLGFTMLQVRISRPPVRWIVERYKPRLIRLGVVVCLLLLALSSYDSVHVHRSVGPLENAPLAPHHCLLCLAAHLPLTMNASPTAPMLPVARAAALVPEQVACYESASRLPLYIRPPPQV